MRRFAQAPQHGLGYRSMCRFFAGPLVDLEIWDELRVEYILRLDTDAFFPAPLSVDPFVRLEQGRGVYGYLTTALEEPAMADGCNVQAASIARVASDGRSYLRGRIACPGTPD